MSTSESDRRVEDRRPLDIQVVVKGRENSEVFWKESTDITNVSRIGANFNLQHECLTGRIVSLMLNMPINLRCYDHDKKFYRVWGLVQHCSPVSKSDRVSYQVGVAFVGKHAPESYATDPLKSYRISGTDSDGFWSIGEAKTPFRMRAHHRFNRSIKARIALIDVDGVETLIDDEAITENIGAGGAALFSSLELNTGDRVKFECEDHGFASICVVRNRQMREGEGTILHLEFSEADFPIQNIVSRNEDHDDADITDEIDDSPIALEIEDAEKSVENSAVEKAASENSDEGVSLEIAEENLKPE